jgi:transposase
MRYELTDHEWAAIKPILPNKTRGVQRGNDRRSSMASGPCDPIGAPRLPRPRDGAVRGAAGKVGILAIARALDARRLGLPQPRE